MCDYTERRAEKARCIITLKLFTANKALNF